jgi:hypothetical protein
VSLTESVKKLETEAEAGRAAVKLLEKVREVLGPVQLPLAAVAEGRLALDRAHRALEERALVLVAVADALNLAGATPLRRFIAELHEEGSAADVAGETKSHIRMLADAYDLERKRVDALSADLEEERAAHSDLRSSMVLRLVEAGRLEDTDTSADGINAAVCGLLEDLECAHGEVHDLKREERVLPPGDLKHLEAMIADEKAMVWDLTSKDRAMLQRVRDMAADAPAPVPSAKEPPPASMYTFAPTAELVNPGERCPKCRRKNRTVRTGCPKCATEQPRETAETPAKSAAPTSAVESSADVEPDEDGGAPPPPSSGGSGPWVIVRTIPRGGRQVMVDGEGKAWLPWREVDVHGGNVITWFERERAEQRKPRRTRVCTLAEALETSPPAEAADGV